MSAPRRSAPASRSTSRWSSSAPVIRRRCSSRTGDRAGGSSRIW